MAQRAEQIIIDVEFNVGQTEKQLGDVTARIKELRNQNEQIRKDLKNGNGDWAANQAILKSNEQELKSLTVAEKDLAGMISVADQQRRKYSDSFRGQAAQLADLKNQYSSLTKAERESAGGKEMFRHLTELDAQVKKNDASMGNFQRNVGNYGLANQKLPGIFGELQSKATSAYASLNKSVSEASDMLKQYLAAVAEQKALQQVANAANVEAAAAEEVLAVAKKENTVTTELQTAAETARAAATNASTAATAAGTNAMKILKVAIASTGIGLLVVALGAVVAYFTQTNEGAKVFQRITAGVNAVVQTGIKILGSYGKLLFDIATMNFDNIKKDFVELKNNIVGAGTEIGTTYKNAVKLKEERQKLTKEEREWSTERIRIEGEIGVLEKKASKQSSLSAKEKKKAAEEAKRLRLEMFDTDIRLAKKNEELVIKEQNINSKKDYQAIQDAKNRTAQVIATKDNEIQSILNKEGKAQDGIDAINENAVVKKQKTLENTEKIIQQYEDAIIAGKTESVQKQIEIEQTNTRRQIEELQNQTDLTSDGIKKRDALIEVLKKNSIDKIAQMEADAKTEEQRKTIEAEQKRLQLLFEVVEKGGAAELDLRLKIIENLRQQELLEAEKTGADKALINKKYDLQEEDAERQSQERIRSLKKQAIDNEFEELRLGLEERNATAVEFANLELQQATAQAAELAKLDQSSFETKEAYDAAVIESKKRVAAATRSVAEAEQQQFAIQVAAAQGFGDAISSVLSELAGDSKEALVFQKLISLAKVSLSLAESIAAATAASTAGDPYTMAARIAANVGGVIIAFSQVTKAIKATQIPQAPRFETGGIVGGASFTGDRITARVNSGEMILNAEQQKNLFRMVANNNYQSGGLDYDLLAKAMSRQPAPALILKEFNDFNQKIVTFDEHIKI